MKKLSILTMLLLVLIGCSNKNEVAVCVKDFDDTFLMSREITLSSTGNVITKIEAVDKITFDDDVSKELFEMFQEEIDEKLADAKVLTYEIEILEDHAIVTTKLSDIDNASAKELSFIGISKDEKDEIAGFKETVRHNEKEGFVCKLENE